MATFILIAVVAALFGLAFLTKRRFGILGLGLCAGALLSTSLSATSAILIDAQNLSVPGLSSETLAAIILTLLPSLLLLLGGPRYMTLVPAVIGAAGYAILGTMLLLGPLSGVLASDGMTRSFLNQVAEVEAALISVTVLLAVLDTLSIHGTTKLGKKQGHH